MAYLIFLKKVNLSLFIIPIHIIIASMIDIKVRTKTVLPKILKKILNNYLVPPPEPPPKEPPPPPILVEPPPPPEELLTLLV